MTNTDTSERGLERLICTGLAGHPCDPPGEGTVADPPAGYGGVGWSSVARSGVPFSPGDHHRDSSSAASSWDVGMGESSCLQVY